MPPEKKLASLRLSHELLERIDRVITELYRNLPASPGRNAVMEAWILKGLEEAEQKLPPSP